MRSWIDVAVLVKTKNLKGRFVAHAATGLPFLLQPGYEVAFVPPQLDVPRRAKVAEVVPVSETRAEVEFEGVDGEAAAVLAGSHCLVRRELVDESAFEEAPGMWEGWTVVDDATGNVGIVCGCIYNPGQALLEVRRPDGSTVLVPVVDDIVRDVDVASETVRTCLPAGLLEL